MKLRLLDYLACPACDANLTSGVEAQDGPDVLEGTLECTGCTKQFPIVRGVPRFADLQNVDPEKPRLPQLRFRVATLHAEDENYGDPAEQLPSVWVYGAERLCTKN